MSFSVSGPKILFRIDLGFLQIPITQTTLSSFVVMVLLMIACILCGRNLKKRPGKRQVIVEKLVTMLYNMVEDTMGAHNMRFAPYMGVLFLSSLFGSLIGTTGFFRSSTAYLVYDGNLGDHDDADRLVFQHPGTGLFRMAEELHRPLPRDDAVEYHQRICKPHFHGLPSFRKCCGGLGADFVDLCGFGSAQFGAVRLVAGNSRKDSFFTDRYSGSAFGVF